MSDPSGVFGSLLSYSLTVAFAGGAFLIFLHLWRKGRLDLDEDASNQMMKQHEDFHE